MPRSRPIFSRFYLLLSRLAERDIATHRDELLAGATGRAVEVGAGNGMNFGHYPTTVTSLVAVEPEPVLRAAAARAAAAAPVPVRIVAGTAEALPLADGGADVVVFSLALCSVADQARALHEAARVLRPGGELRFYEHVRAAEPGHARWQRRLDRVWPLFAGGCHTARDTPTAIERAGFAMLDIRRFDLDAPLTYPVRPHAIGRARRS